MSEQVRREFEEWAESRGLTLRTDEEGNYKFGYGFEHWEGWKASRAALVIELPDVMDARPDGSGRYELFEMSATDYREECKLIIEAAGLGVRS